MFARFRGRGLFRSLTRLVWRQLCGAWALHIRTLSPGGLKPATKGRVKTGQLLMSLYTSLASLLASRFFLNRFFSHPLFDYRLLVYGRPILEPIAPPGDREYLRMVQEPIQNGRG